MRKGSSSQAAASQLWQSSRNGTASSAHLPHRPTNDRIRSLNTSIDTHDATIPIEDAYPLFPLQHGMLVNALLEPGTGVDIEQLCCELHEVLDVAAFQRAWRCVVARHPVLRTSLRWDNLDEPQQVVHARIELPWEERDWRAFDGNQRDKYFSDFLDGDRLCGFDLSRAPLLRLTLLRYGEAEYRLVLTFHHTILEGRSYLLVLREVFALYEAFRCGCEITLPLPRPYRDYIDWIQQQDFSKDEAFWRETLKGFTTPTPLVVDHAPDTFHDRRPRHGSCELVLPAQITSTLRALAQANQLTLNTIVQGAWAVLLSRYSGEVDVVFGVVRGNRRSTIEGAEAMIGLFLNTLPLRVRVNPEAALLSWLHEVRRQWTAMRGHEHTPLAQVQGWSEVPGGAALFQSTMMFENYHLDTMLQEQGGAWSKRRFRLFLQTNYPVSLAVFDGAVLRLRLDFDHSRIDEAAAGRMLGHLQTLFEAIAAHPEQRVGELPLLTESERRQLLVEWNDTAADYPRDRCLHQLFEAQAARTPEAVAVVFEDLQLTYGEINARANQLSRHLIAMGVGPEVLVGICLERSLELIVGLLSILKAGGAYVPLDPTYPTQRLAFMLKDTQAPVLLTQQALLAQLPQFDGRLLCIDRDWTLIAAQPHTTAPCHATVENLAYVIYTSGSTGTPKGVMVTHANVARLFSATQPWFNFSKQDIWTCFHSCAFDFSVWEIWGALIYGGRLVMVPYLVSRDPDAFHALLRRERVTVLNQTPSAFRQLIAADARVNLAADLVLRLVIFGGEALEMQSLRPWFDRHGDAQPQLVNMYGITETTVHVTYRPICRKDLDAARGSMIGVRIPDLRVHILDRHLQPVPVGVPGEIYVGGAGVARGYLNRAELTAERFVVDPFTSDTEARLYRSGDLARLTPSGDLEYIGRIDDQVKIRGFRIELGEIEAVLCRLPQVQEAVVVVREDELGDRSVVAYLVPADDQADAPGDLRSILKQHLPDYMVPSAFVTLDRLPLTPSGKVDRRALPAADSAHQLKPAYVPPRTEWELKLTDIWQKVLQVEKVSVDENFFDLGGHSLMIVQLIHEINRTYKVSLSVPEVFRNPTVQLMAALIDRQPPKSNRQPSVVHLREGRTEIPVYFIHAGPDEFRLAHWMGGSHSVFGIDVPWPLAWRKAVSENRKSAFPSMDQLVAPYVAALSAHARSSSCVLAGHSFAGLIAFEAAHQFQKCGGKVEMVFLLDSWARAPSPYKVAWHNLWDCWKRASDGLPEGRRARSTIARVRRSWRITRWLVEQQQTRFPLFFRRPELNPNDFTTWLDEQGMPLPEWITMRLQKMLRRSYHPRPLDSWGILFRANSQGEHMIVRGFDESLGWKNLFARGLEIIPTPGDHLSMIREHDSILARKLDHVLERHGPSASDHDDGKAGGGWSGQS